MKWLFTLFHKVGVEGHKIVGWSEASVLFSGAFCTFENDCSFLIAFEIVRGESRSECHVPVVSQRGVSLLPHPRLRHHHHSELSASFLNASSFVRGTVATADFTVVPVDVTVLLRNIVGKANREKKEKEEKTMKARKGKKREGNGKRERKNERRKRQKREGRREEKRKSPK